MENENAVAAETDSLMDLAASGEFESFEEMVESLEPKSPEGEVGDEDETKTEDEENSEEKIEQESDGEEEVVTTPGEVDESKIAEIKAKLEKVAEPTQPAPAPSAPQPTPQETTPEPSLPKMEGRPEMPKRIPMPDLPKDPQEYTLADEKALNQYILDRAKYDEEMENYLAAIGQGYDGVGKVIGEVERMKEIEFQRIAQAEQERKERAYWDSISDFQKTNDFFATSKDVKTAREESLQYEDVVAALAGVVNNGDDVVYNSQVSLAMQLLEAGDPSLTAKVTEAGVEKPEDYDKYKSLVELDSFRNEAIQKGSLGPNASLEDAYALSRFKNGDFQSAIENVAKEATVDAVRDVAKVVQEAQDAVKTPSQASQQGTETGSTGISSIDKANLSIEEMKMLEEMSNDMSLLSDPKYEAVYLKTQG